MSKRIFSVTIPIAGHVTVDVEADDEKSAIEKAWGMNLGDSDCIEWEAVEKFNSGNVCHCPSPWQVEVEDMGPAEEEAA